MSVPSRSPRDIGRCVGRRANRRPYVLVGLRLALNEAITGLRPRPYLVAHVVENEVAFVGLHGQNGMTFVVLVLDHGHEQRLARQAFLDQELALQKRIILAIALAVGWIIPLVDDKIGRASCRE